jgi:hypothetical protein
MDFIAFRNRCTYAPGNSCFGQDRQSRLDCQERRVASGRLQPSRRKRALQNSRRDVLFLKPELPRRQLMKRPVLFVAALALAGGVGYAAGSGCVGCHTDGARMKELFIPPVVIASEGEG